MKSKIIILNVMKYTKKGTDNPMTRIEFAFSDMQDVDKYKGVTVISCYFKGHEVFDKIDKSMLLKTIDAEFDIIQDYYNPLSTRKMLKAVNDISLF